MINDYSKASSQKRLFILNKCTGEVKAMQSAHGRGGSNGVAASGGSKLNGISNTPDTNASPSGFFVLGDWHTTEKRWGPGIKMHGLERVPTIMHGRGGLFFIVQFILMIMEKSYHTVVVSPQVMISEENLRDKAVVEHMAV
jgi:hypothetical protein